MRPYGMISLMICLTGCLVNSTKKDVIKFYNSNGDSVEAIYSADSGYLKSIAVIKNNKRNGLYKSYYENGRTREIGLMRNNLKEGLWMSFDKDSILLRAAHFFNDTLVIELDKTDFEFVEKKMAINNCSISIPSRWEIEPLYNNAVLLGAHKRCNAVVFCPNIVLLSHNNLTDVSFTSFVDEYLNMLKDEYERLEIVYQRNLKIDNKNACQMGVKLVKNNINLAAVITLIKGDGKVFELTGMAPSEKPGDFFKYKGLFEQMAVTFKADD